MASNPSTFRPPDAGVTKMPPHQAIIKGFAYQCGEYGDVALRLPRADIQVQLPLPELGFWCVIYQPYTPSGAEHGRPAEQKVTFQARHAPLAQRTHRAGHRRGIHHRRNPPAPPHQPHRFLPRPQGAENQIRSVTPRFEHGPALILRAFLLPEFLTLT